MRIIRKATKHLVIFLIIISVILSFSALLHVYGPREYSYYDDSWDHLKPYVPETNITYNVLFDQHSHTIYSDGFLTVRQNIEWHIAMGFTAIAITDHNTLSNSDEILQLAEEYKNEIIVLQGMEWTTLRIHLNFIGISEWPLKIPVTPTDVEIQEAINEVHNQKGVVSVNHFPATEKYAIANVPTREDLIAWGVDFIEIVNGRDFDYESYQLYLENKDSFGVITGTDMHSPEGRGGRVHAWTTMNVTDFSKEAIMSELRAHNTFFITNPYGVEAQGNYKVNTVYRAFRPFYKIGEGLEQIHLENQNIQSTTIAVFLLYSFGSFLFGEFLIIVKNTISFRRKRNKKKLVSLQK
ncbi:MAG: PHP domain-containing protein [Promethearchaeota archaeon]